MSPPTALTIDFPLHQTLTRLTYDWAESYDSKDFKLFASIMAPTVTLDYTEGWGQPPVTLQSAELIKLLSSENSIGGLVDGMHVIGGSKYDRTSEDEVVGSIQVCRF